MSPKSNCCGRKAERTGKSRRGRGRRHFGPGPEDDTNGYVGQEPLVLNLCNFSYAIPRKDAWLSPQLVHPSFSIGYILMNYILTRFFSTHLFFSLLDCSLKSGVYAEARAL